MIGCDPSESGTQSLRRAKVTLAHRRTRNLGAVQLLPGRTELEYTVRYLDIEVDAARDISAQSEA